MENSLGKFIRYSRGKKSLRNYASKIGISYAYLSCIEKGYDSRTKDKVNVGTEILKKISKVTNVSVNALLDMISGTDYTLALKREEFNNNVLENSMSQEEIAKLQNNLTKEEKRILFDDYSINNKSNKIPILGKIPAGIPIEAIEDIIDYEEISEDMLKGGKEYFGLKIKGNSMSPKYFDSDIILFLKINDCESGDDCAVIVNGNDAVFKRVIKQEKGILLQSLNAEYESKFYSCDEIEDLPICIIGIAKEIRRKI